MHTPNIQYLIDYTRDLLRFGAYIYTPIFTTTTITVCQNFYFPTLEMKKYNRNLYTSDLASLSLQVMLGYTGGLMRLT